MHRLPPPATKISTSPVSRSRIPNSAQKYLAALGDRVTKPGLERTVTSGRIQLASGQSEAIQWAWEFPGHLRLDREGKAGAVIFSLDDKRALPITDLDDEILEALSADTAETLFSAMQNGVQCRMLGYEFETAGATGFGSKVDIFELADAVNARSQKGASVKHYHFDSATGLLARVVYQKQIKAQPVKIRTEYSNYAVFGGQKMPSRIVRYQSGLRVFQIDLQGSTWQASAKDGLFGVGSK